MNKTLSIDHFTVRLFAPFRVQSLSVVFMFHFVLHFSGIL